MMDFSLVLYAFNSNRSNLFCFHVGDNLIWTSEERAAAALGASGAKIGPLLRVRDSGSHFTDRSFHSYCSLASVYLARDW